MKKTSYLLVALISLTSLVSACGSPTNDTFDSLQTGQNIQINSTEKVSNLAQKMGLGLNTKGLAHLTEVDQTEKVTNASLPEKVDLRAGFSPIYNQQNTNACVGFATVGGLGEYLMRKKGVKTAFSPRFLWNMGRKLEKSLDQNVGMYFTDAVKVIDAYGMLPEEDLPFNEKLFAYNPKPTQEELDQQKKDLTEVPTSKMIQEAKKYKVSQGWVNINSVHAMKKALSKGFPVVFGVNIYDSFYKTTANGVVAVPKATEVNHGGHAIVAVGYDNSKRQLIIRNSWGTQWGDKGYAYLPYDFLKNEDLAFGGFTAKF